MRRSVGSGSGGSGTALPPNTTSTMGGTRQATRKPGPGSSGKGSAMPPNSGPGYASRSATGVAKHGKASYGAN